MAQITNKLLKQAIADAEAVRETAIANAKLVLEESIAPQVKEMIARRLRVEAEMGAEEEKEMEEATEKPFEDGEAEGSSEMPADASDIGTGDNKEPSDDAFDTSDIGTGPEAADAPEGDETDWYEDWDEADFDLGEIIKELENDIASLSGSEEEEPAEAPVAEAKEEEEEKEELKEEKEEEKEEKKDVKEVAQGADVNKHTRPEMANEAEGHEDEEEVDLEEILAELEAEEAPEKEDEKSAMMSKLAGLKNELAQYREAVNVLRGRLQEVNLLNAKLLFTNKLFRKEGLNSDQKVRIVESFDRATTVREVKLVYTALVENLATQARAFNSSRKKVVAEGLASKPTPSTAPKAEVIVENTVAKRLQQLAGII